MLTSYSVLSHTALPCDFRGGVRAGGARYNTISAVGRVTCDVLYSGAEREQFNS